MEKKITDKQLAFLEDYLKRKKLFSDEEERFELMDHLICDFEVNGNGNLTQYLADCSWFISQYGAKRNSNIHWGYQSLLWKKLFSFFVEFNYFPITIIIGLSFLYLSYSLNEKLLFIAFFISIIGQIIYGFYLTYHHKKRIRKLMSFKYLGNIMGLPQVFLYSLSLTKSFLADNRLFFFFCWFLVFGLSVAGILVIKEKRELLLKKYKYLLR